MHPLEKIDWTSVKPNLIRIAQVDFKTYKSLSVFFAILSPVLIFIFWPAFFLSLLLCVYFFKSYQKGQIKEFLVADFVIEKRERYERFNSEHYNPKDAEAVDMSSKIFYVIPKNMVWLVLNENGLKPKNVNKKFERLVVYEFMYKQFLAGDKVAFIMNANMDTLAYVLDEKVYYLEKIKKLSDGSSMSISMSLSQQMGKGKNYFSPGLHDYQHFINE